MFTFGEVEVYSIIQLINYMRRKQAWCKRATKPVWFHCFLIECSNWPQAIYSYWLLQVEMRSYHFNSVSVYCKNLNKVAWWRLSENLKVSFKKTHHRSSQPTCSWLRCMSFPNENVCYIFKKHKHDKVSHLSKHTHLLLECLCLQHRAVVCGMPPQNVIFNGFSVDNKCLMRRDVSSKDAVLVSVFPWRY